MKKLFIIFCFLLPLTVSAQTVLGIQRGGTGTSTSPAYGQILVGNSNGLYTYFATSSLGITVAGDGTFSTTSANYWVGSVLPSTTTTALPEGNNLYWTNTRFDNRLSASSSISGITTLPNLSLPSAQVVGFFSYPFTNNGTSTIINFTGGIVVTASSTFSNLGFGEVASNNGRLYNAATTTFGTGLSYTNGQVTNTGVLSNAGDWAGTWQSNNPSAFDTFAYPFPLSATSSTLTLTGGFVDTASTTFPALGFGEMGLNNGRLYAAATTTFNSPLTYSNGSVSCSTCLTANQSITLSGAVTGTGATAITTAFGTLGQGILGNPATAATIPTAQATSTLFGDIATFKTTGKVGIGSTTPFAILSITQPITNAMLFAVATSSANNSNVPVFEIDSNGHQVISGATPTLSGCGTTPSVLGNDNAGKITVGTGIPLGCRLTFAATYGTNAPSCTLTGAPPSAVNYTGNLISSTTATTLQFSIKVSTTTTATATDWVPMTSWVVSYRCFGLQ